MLISGIVIVPGIFFFVRNYKLISIRFFTFNVIIFVFVKT